MQRARSHRTSSPVCSLKNNAITNGGTKVRSFMYRLTKTIASLSYLLMIWLTWRWAHAGFDMTFSVGCLALSGLWLGLTVWQMNHLLRTYFDTLSRLQVVGPLALGLVLTGLAMHGSDTAPVQVLGLFSLLGWTAIYVHYRRARKQYEEVGHGPLPKGVLLNPRADKLRFGDIILTSGRIATTIHEAIGHGEIVVRHGGKMMSFSAYMEDGTVLNPIEQVATGDARQGHYIVMRQRVPWTEEELLLTEKLVDVMLAENKAWIAKTRAFRDNLCDRLHLPAWLKARVQKRFPITGYDWIGLFMGRRACDHWTCIAAVTELVWRMGRVMRWLGTGLLGLGTGLLDPIAPARFLSEPSLRLLTVEDDQASDATHTTSGGSGAGDGGQDIKCAC